MVLDRYHEKTVKGSIGNAAKGKRRLESGVENCNKINKRLGKPTHMETNKNGRVSKVTSKRYNRKEEDDDDDDDDDEDVSVASTCDEAMESSGESMNDDAGGCLSELEIMQMSRRPKVAPKRKKLNERVETKKKNPIANPQAKMKKSKFEFAAEPMDVSDEEDDEKMMQQEYRKYRGNPRNISKKQLAVITAELKKKKGLAGKIEKKPKKVKAKTTPKKRALKKKKGRNESEDDNSPDNATCEKSGNVTEQKTSKQAMQSEKSSGDNANNYNADTADKKGNSVGDTRNLNNEKAAAEEKKATAAANKAPGHADITAKASKDNDKNEANKDPKGKEKVEDISKKVDQKEAKDMDEGVDMPRSNPRATRLRKPRHPSIKMMRLSSGKPPKNVSPCIKFYMSVYRELCDTLSIKAIAKEAAKRWKGMSAEEKNKFYSKKIE